jgi:histidinol-phosphate aminotransferase
MMAALAAMPAVEVFTSAANFILIRIAGAGLSGSAVFERLLAHKVLVKNVGKMHPLLDNCLRITVSTPAENAQFEAALASSLQP